MDRGLKTKPRVDCAVYGYTARTPRETVTITTRNEVGTIVNRETVIDRGAVWNINNPLFRGRL